MAKRQPSLLSQLTPDPEDSPDTEIYGDHDARLQTLVERVAEILELPDADQSSGFKRLREEFSEHTRLLIRMERVAADLQPGSQRRATITRLMSPTGVSDPGEVVRIGPYRILEILGEGGMGTVYLAEQREPIRRRVALKVIKIGMATKQVLARFELERQALAVMSHPAIDQLRVNSGGKGLFNRMLPVLESIYAPPATGLLVTNGLRPGSNRIGHNDLILEYGGHKIRTRADLTRVDSNTKLGQIVPVKILRAGNEHILQITVTSTAPGHLHFSSRPIVRR